MLREHGFEADSKINFYLFKFDYIKMYTYFLIDYFKFNLLNIIKKYLILTN